MSSSKVTISTRTVTPFVWNVTKYHLSRGAGKIGGRDTLDAAPNLKYVTTQNRKHNVRHV